MDPNTGKFHRLSPLVTDVWLEAALALQAKSRYRPARMGPIEATKPVPKDWPVFSVGEKYELFGREFEIAQISPKDLHLRGDTGGIERSAECELQGRVFRVRFTRGHFVVVRPVIGRLTRG